MSLTSTDEIVREIEAQMSPRLDKAADYLAYKFRAALPRRTGHTAANVDWIKIRDGRVVRIPFPWQFNEFGTIHQRANPVGRRTLLESKDDLEKILNGEL
jgi:hypothetical protein